MLFPSYFCRIDCNIWNKINCNFLINKAMILLFVYDDTKFEKALFKLRFYAFDKLKIESCKIFLLDHGRFVVFGFFSLAEFFLFSSSEYSDKNIFMNSFISVCHRFVNINFLNFFIEKRNNEAFFCSLLLYIWCCIYFLIIFTMKFYCENFTMKFLL